MRKSRILIVDDRELNRYIRSEVLRKAGYDTYEAANGKDALERCANSDIDMALLDVHLPDISGFKICQRIKTDAQTRGIMVIQISASAVEIRDAVIGLESGADDYLIEPVEPELLVAKVRSLLRLREAEEDLRRSNEDLTKFAYVASHDLQAPLRAIVTSAELLERNSKQMDEPSLQLVHNIATSAKRMVVLIRDLLRYSQATSDAPVDAADTEQVDLNAVVAESKNWIAERLSEANGTLTAGALPVILGSHLRLVQLMNNLMENSIKYRRPEVPLEIHVDAERRFSEWVISVRDNGQGFEPKFAETIFGVFQRLHGGDVSGSGIGLAICKAIVERSGGRIWAVGSPGQGATFYFSSPGG